MQRIENETIARLTDAFVMDGYDITATAVYSGRTGVAAEHRTAVNYDSGRRKKAYYVEGTAYEMGYLLGLLAEKDIAAMTSDFTDRIVFAFIRKEQLNKLHWLQELLIHLIYGWTKRSFDDLPQPFREEMKGLYDGCRQKNPGTRVAMDRLIVLNTGIDTLCSMIYTGNFSFRTPVRLRPSFFRIPLMCNAFAVFGASAARGHYFAREFMFPTADIFQDTAASVLYNPAVLPGEAAHPFVSITAPGMVGSIAAMNKNGLAVGVDMSPGANCNPRKTGVNSLLLARLCVQHAAGAEEAVDVMTRTPRGVSWNYILADGRRDKACVVEAGASDFDADVMEWLPSDLKPWLPDESDGSVWGKAADSNGLMVRWNDYRYPLRYLDYNQDLWRQFNESNRTQKQLNPDALGRVGFINRTPDEKNCPATYYFAPQREESDELVICTNHFIIPEMRYFAMHPWTADIVSNSTDDIQWRYDELNRQIQETLASRGYIDYEEARRLIEYLAPYGRFPGYYGGNPKSKDGRETRIEGCVSLFDLKRKTVESHFGYYCDPWVKITLPRYFI